MLDIETSACAIQGWKFSGLPPLSPFSHPLSPFIYVVIIVVNTIHTFVLLREGNLICWWSSVIHV
jgi:hypothetical protein